MNSYVGIRLDPLEFIFDSPRIQHTIKGRLFYFTQPFSRNRVSLVCAFDDRIGSLCFISRQNLEERKACVGTMMKRFYAGVNDARLYHTSLMQCFVL